MFNTTDIKLHMFNATTDIKLHVFNTTTNLKLHMFNTLHLPGIYMLVFTRHQMKLLQSYHKQMKLLQMNCKQAVAIVP